MHKRKKKYIKRTRHYARPRAKFRPHLFGSSLKHISHKVSLYSRKKFPSLGFASTSAQQSLILTPHQFYLKNTNSFFAVLYNPSRAKLLSIKATLNQFFHTTKNALFLQCLIFTLLLQRSTLTCTFDSLQQSAQQKRLQNVFPPHGLNIFLRNQSLSKNNFNLIKSKFYCRNTVKNSLPAKATYFRSTILHYKKRLKYSERQNFITTTQSLETLSWSGRQYLFFAKTFFLTTRVAARKTRRLQLALYFLSEERLFATNFLRVNRSDSNFGEDEFFFAHCAKIKSVFTNHSSFVFKQSFDFLVNDTFFESFFISNPCFSRALIFKNFSRKTRLIISKKLNFVKVEHSILRKKIEKLGQAVVYANIQALNYKQYNAWSLRAPQKLAAVPQAIILKHKEKKHPVCSYVASYPQLAKIFSAPLLLKYLALRRNALIANQREVGILAGLRNQLTHQWFTDRSSANINANILPHQAASLRVKKKFLTISSYHKFASVTTPWYYHTFVRFVESCSGKKVFLKLNTKLLMALTFDEKLRCSLWAHKLKSFRKVLGPRLFIGESLQILLATLKLKDPYFFSHWMTAMFQKISFWKYKSFLRYFKYILRYFFWGVFSELQVIGFKMQLKGKISVAGNARTRKVVFKIGKTGHATLKNRVVTHFTLIRSFTGAMGFKLWIYF